MTVEIARAGHRVPPVARLAILTIGFAWALAAEAIRLAAGWPIVWVIGDLLPGLAFLLCGYVAWTRTPDSRIGPLMVAIGFAWYAGTASAAGIHVVDRLAHALQGYYDALLAWLILAYPTGRLMWRSSRLVVGAFFAVLAARTVFRLLVFPWPADLDVADPGAVDRYVALVTLREQGASVFGVLIALLAAAVLVLAVARWRAATGAGRAVAGPILLGGAGFALGILVETAALVQAADFSERTLAWDIGQSLTVLTASAIPIGFLVGLGQDRIARGRVADLVVRLGGGNPGVDELQSTLRESLRDPSLVVAYAVEGTGSYVDAWGTPVRLPSVDEGRAVTRIDRGGRTIAALVHDSALAQRPGSMTSVAAATGLALENERLHAELRAQLAEVQASRARIVAAGDAERRRVERDLHDGAQQRFVTLALALQLARSRAGREDRELDEMLGRAADELERGLSELRELARGIHPTALTEDGLAAAIDALVERSPVRVTASVRERRCGPAIETAAYYVVAEALTNVAKYAPTSTAAVVVAHDSGVLRVEVRDDGPGGAIGSPGSGLRGLADRVEAVGGRLSVESPAGGGTTVRAVIPCA
jgi:signal transduction histidine kinase